MSQTLTKVTKDEFDAWLNAYPRPLEREVLTICEPPIVRYNDFSLERKWPSSVVAQYRAYGGHPTDMWALVPCDHKVAYTD